MEPAKCFRCKKPGHYSRDCPDQFDIRAMTLDEIQEVMENRLARLDVAPDESNEPPAEISHASPEVPATEEGFPLSSE